MVFTRRIWKKIDLYQKVAVSPILPLQLGFHHRDTEKHRGLVINLTAKTQRERKGAATINYFNHKGTKTQKLSGFIMLSLPKHHSAVANPNKGLAGYFYQRICGQHLTAKARL